MTASITETDLRRLLDIASPTATDDGLEVPPEMLVGLSELIPCASISFFVMDTRRSSILASQELTLADLPEEDAEADALFFSGYWDCIACSYPERSGDHTSVTMWHDFYSEREFSRLVMADYFRKVGIWHELLVSLPAVLGHERRLMLTRQVDDIPFSERDRLLLTLLRPHLAATRDRVEAVRRTVPILTERQRELMRRVALGHTNRQVARDLGLSEGTVRKHLENIYARLEVNSRTEALARLGDVLSA
jgi:DNA-binding CsgD family transcriptional regulator